MQVKVLVVEDSSFYRKRLCEFLESDPNIHVVGTAQDGDEAIEKVLSLKPNVITMDIEMPVMSGIPAVREIMKVRPTPIIMVSTLTSEGAQATLDALDAGAVDFIEKHLAMSSLNNTKFARTLCDKIRVLGGRVDFFSKSLPRNEKSSIQSTPNKISREANIEIDGDVPSSLNSKIVVIGASTGGPIALQSIITALPEDFPVPILIVQHMPAVFTTSFAHRLDALSNLRVKETEDNDVVTTGTVYLAPGGRQMLLEKQGSNTVLRVRDSYAKELYKPSVDITYKSVAGIYGKSALAIILTGMGSDGLKGSALLKKSGSNIWAQDENTSVVYGMPQAVINAGLADRILPITQIASQLGLEV